MDLDRPMNDLLGSGKRLITHLSLWSLFWGCGGGVIQRVDQGSLPPPPSKKGFLQLPPGPPHTKIYLDDRFIGRYTDYPREMILLPIGPHLLKLSASDHATIYARVNISSSRPFRFKRSLIKHPTYHLSSE